MKYKGKKSRFYFYDVYVVDDDEHWLAVAGPYNVDRKDISLSAARAEVYSEATYDASELKSQMDALIKQMEKSDSKVE